MDKDGPCSGEQLDLLCDNFERAVESGDCPDLGTFIRQTTPQVGAIAFRELLLIDLEFKQRAGETPAARSYEQQFPEFRDVIAKAFAGHGVTAKWPTGLETLFERSVLPDLPPHVMATLSTEMVPVSFRAGDILIRQGAPADCLYVVTDGRLDVVTESGKVGEIEGEAIVGEMALLANAPRTATIVAKTDGQALSLEAKRFHELAREHPALTHVLTRLMASRLGTQEIDVLAGKTFAGYDIHRRVGRGGMSVVYKATERASNQRIALKMMSHRLVYDEFLSRQFEREATIIESFNHHNIVRLRGRFDAFHTQFLVLEFCEGTPLDELIRCQGPLDVSLIRQLAAQIADALLYAHSAGIVHRDVKPSNIMANKGHVRLMDFGLAKPVFATADAGATLVGTPRYMAPEQILENRSLPASDLFSFGCTLFEMITGRPLIASTRMSRIVETHSQWVIPRLLRERPVSTPEIDATLLACLQQRPEDRTVDLASVATWARS